MTGPVATEIVSAAPTWLGTPYQHQASVKGAGTDCLGLVRGVWREIVGPEVEPVPAYTSDWAEASGKEVLLSASRRILVERPMNEAEPGDVLLFRMRRHSVAKHMGIIASTRPEWTFIHAYSGHGVVESALTDSWHEKVVACFSFPDGVV